jgi:hypothetical protein
MSKLKIIYNKEFDTQRVIDTIGRIDWFVQNNYNYKNFSFPKSLNKEKLKSYSEQEIKDAVSAEYSEGTYEKNEKFLLENRGKISEEIILAFKKTGLVCQDEY